MDCEIRIFFNLNHTLLLGINLFKYYFLLKSYSVIYLSNAMRSGCLVVRMRHANNEVLQGSTPRRVSKISVLFTHSQDVLSPSQMSTNNGWRNSLSAET